MKRLLLLVAIGAAAGGTAVLLAQTEPASAGARASPEGVFRVGVGDEIRVAGANVVCKVEKRDRVTEMTCVGSGRLDRTYGTRITKRRVTVFRFESRAVARTVFSATHKAGFSLCGHCR